MRTGDLLGSGTISGLKRGELGSMLEQSKNGKEEIMLAGMDTRTFLCNGDTVIISGICEAENGVRLGFGDCIGRILPSANVDDLTL